MGYYAVIDLEMCMVPYGDKRKQFGHKNELIQIGAVLINDELDIIESFVTYVKPEFGSIDQFIQKLTGISNKDVENAPTAEKALRMLSEWLPDDVEMVSWSDSDLYQLQAELNGKHISIPKLERLFETWIDCQYEFSYIADSDKCYKLTDALNMSDIFYDENVHDALVDAKNTALLFVKMEREGDDFQFSPYYSTGNSSSGFCPFANKFAEFSMA